ncbi:hypothetical protein KAS50_00100 [bacterium]|nr:hypothetical protein [bacterium]
MKKMFLYVPLIVFAILLSCAQPKEPVGPNWTLSLTKIPIMSADTIEIGKELEGDNIQADAVDLLHVSFTNETEFSVDDQMRLDSASENFVGGPNIPTQRFEFGTQIQINDRPEFSVNSAVIAQGDYYIDMDFNNTFSFDINLEISISQLKDNQDNPFYQNIQVQPGQSNNRFYISENTITLNGGNLSIDAVVNIPQPVWGGDDYFSIIATVSELDFSEVTADIDNIQEQFIDVNENLFDDPPEGLDNFELAQADFSIRMLNVPFDVATNFDITTRKDGAENSLTRGVTIPGGDQTSHGFDIAEVINTMPENITISGFGTVSGTNVTITRGTKFRVEYTVDVPLQFSVMQSSTIEETDKLDIDKDARDAIKDNLINAGMEGIIINETPLSGSLELYVGASEISTTSKIFSISLPGRGSEGVIDLNISKSDLDILADANYYRYYVTLDAVSDAQIKSTDYIIVKDIFLSGSGKIDLEDLDDDE